MAQFGDLLKEAAKYGIKYQYEQSSKEPFQIYNPETGRWITRDKPGACRGVIMSLIHYLQRKEEFNASTPCAGNDAGGIHPDVPNTERG